ncbi:DUF342 domain-containing protein [Domibacillus epiphyticus]|uniref:Flagellar Assembly Protein A N-terminal region domain-containing protein n=1 Tax=Domibacillus epiphyticus TaxID=1714355 RepID=A0A1V2A7J5_9BACI|nr:FapA family protein [Domibacillus epiphyticus]OMP66917.1 hypothetical protein BTO28_09930 [Domibacillus epiphyticus]
MNNLLTKEKKEVCRIDVSSDYMEAVLHYSPGRNDENEPVNELTPEIIHQLLEGIGVVHGIDDQVIEGAIHCLQNQSFTIATATPPVAGIDGSLTFFVDYSTGLTPPKLDWSGAANFRDIQVIPEVQEGSIIAKANPAVQGTPGISVLGIEIPVRPALDVVVQTGKGIYEKDGSYFASFSGRLSVEQRDNRYFLDVSKQLVHNGAVDITSGNIRFQGDIEINGDVHETMKVEAAGDIEVYGQVSNASLIAGKSASVKKNVFSSTISSGKSVESTGGLYKHLNGCLPVVIEFSKKLEAVLLELEKRGHSIDEAVVAQKLMEREYPNLPSLIKLFAREASHSGHSVKREWSELANNLYRTFIMKSMNGLRIDQVNSVLNDAEALHAFYDADEEDEEPLFVSMPYALNSEIFSSGNIYITGQGVYNSTLKAGRSIEVAGSVKGGHLIAGQFVKVKHAGSESGVKTKITVGEGGTIELYKAHADVTVQIGMKKLTFYRMAGPIKVFMNEAGDIKTSGLTY